VFENVIHHDAVELVRRHVLRKHTDDHLIIGPGRLLGSHGVRLNPCQHGISSDSTERLPEQPVAAADVKNARRSHRDVGEHVGAIVLAVAGLQFRHIGSYQCRPERIRRRSPWFLRPPGPRRGPEHPTSARRPFDESSNEPGDGQHRRQSACWSRCRRAGSQADDHTVGDHCVVAVVDRGGVGPADPGGPQGRKADPGLVDTCEVGMMAAAPAGIIPPPTEMPVT